MKGIIQTVNGVYSADLKTAQIRCTINCSGLHGEISSATLGCRVKDLAVVNDAVLGNIVIVEDPDIPYYEDPYEVTPTPEGLSLSTRGKAMSDDVTVNPIPYYKTSNEHGYTIYIGGTP